MNERFYCDIVGATVTQPICEDRIERQALDCAGCPKFQDTAPAITPDVRTGRPVCGVEGCSNLVEANGLCYKHYYEARKDKQSTGGARPSGSAEGRKEMADKKKCSCGCGKNAVKDGLSWACYVKKHGTKPYDNGAAKKEKKPKPEMAESVRKRIDPRLLQRPEASPVKGGMKPGNDIMERIMGKRASLLAEVAEIDSLIETLNKYAA